jgi:DNA-binding beta-propeller fold protein YncE
MNGLNSHSRSLLPYALPGIAREADVSTYPSNNFNRSRSLSVNCFAALRAMLAIGLGAMAWPGETLAWTGQPLAYVTSSNGISVIDTGDNKVVNTIPGPALPTAVAPDGKHLYAFGS